jgi:cytochrome c553
MKHMLTAFYARPLASYLIAALLAVSALAGPAEAMLLPASPETAQAVPAFDRAADLARIQKTLEAKELQQRLQDYGLTPEEATARIDRLSDEQVHELAANLDSVQAGGDALGFLLGVVIIALLVVLIIYLLEGRIEIKNK